jgi:hypothetical protein
VTIIDNTGGFGVLAGVAYTTMQGAGLGNAQQILVDQDAASAWQAADTLLRAVLSAINRDSTTFSLNDLHALGELPQLSAGATTAADWAAFIGRVLGTDLSAAQTDGLNGWRRVASDLQGVAARLASQADPSGGADGGGGVTHANGQWYANGQALSLLDLFTAVRVNQVANYGNSIDGYLEEMQTNQRLLNAARAWGAFLRSHRPAPAGQDTPTATLTQTQVETFKATWGMDPIATFTPSAKGSLGSAKAATDWDIWLADLKSYVDLKDTDNSTLKGQLDQKYNRQSEIIEAMASFSRKEARTSSKMAASLD